MSLRKPSDRWREGIYLVSPITEAAFVIVRIAHVDNLIWLRPLETPWMVVPNRISALVAAGYRRVRRRDKPKREAIDA